MTGGIDGVARAKSELVAALPADGTAILNADDERVAAMAELTAATVLTYGSRGDVRPSAVELDARARARFTIDTPWGRGRVQLAIPGRHMVSNAAAALAVAGTVGVPLDDAIDALAGAQVSAMRMALRVAASGATILNDAYNANPTSMAAALDALAAMDAERRVAVLGTMAELADPDVGHRRVAEQARRLGVELIAVGTDGYGVAPVDDVLAAIGPLDAGTVVLVKASRSAGLERVVTQLVGDGAPASG